MGGHKAVDPTSVCVECDKLPARVRDWCWTCYTKIRQRKDFVRAQPRAPVEALEVRTCSNCYWPLPIGRTVRGLCVACDAYRVRTGRPRQAPRARELEVVATLARDLIAGMATVHDLADAIADLERETARFLSERHMTKLRSMRASGVSHDSKWVVR